MKFPFTIKKNLVQPDYFNFCKHEKLPTTMKFIKKINSLAKFLSILYYSNYLFQQNAISILAY